MPRRATPLVIARMLESDGPGGAELVMLRLSEALRERGHRIVPVGPATGCGWLAEQYRARGFVPRTFWLRHPLDFTCLREMIAMLRAERVEVVHSHEFTMALYGTACSRWLGRPHVITMHGNQTMTRRARRRVLLRAAFRYSAATVAVSADTKRFLDAALHLPGDLVRVVANGVPLQAGNRERGRAELAIAPEERLVLAVGSLVPRKGHAVLIRALAALGSDVSWRLAIAGGGAERDGLAALAGELGVQERVRLLGHRDDVPDLTAACDVFAMPSLWEGLPLALLEAMVAGKGIVASRTAGIPEAITDGVEGMLTTPGDVPELAAALRRLLTNGEWRTRLALAAQARAAAEFSIDSMADAYERIYVEALGAPAAALGAPTDGRLSPAS